MCFIFINYLPLVGLELDDERDDELGLVYDEPERDDELGLVYEDPDRVEELGRV